jgi:hypothetical protein
MHSCLMRFPRYRRHSDLHVINKYLQATTGAEFTYRDKELHRTTQKITEFVPGKKVVWHVVESRINFVADKTERNGTDVVFGITRKGDKSELRFTHVGLVPAIQCYRLRRSMRLLHQRQFAQPDYEG